MHLIAKILIIMVLLDIIMFSFIPTINEITSQAGILSGFASTLYLVAIAVINASIVYIIVKQAENY